MDRLMLSRRNLLSTLIAAPLGLKVAQASSTEWPQCEGDLSYLPELIENWRECNRHRAQDAGVLHEVANILEHDAPWQESMSSDLYTRAAKALRNAAERIKSQDYSEEIAIMPPTDESRIIVDAEPCGNAMKEISEYCLREMWGKKVT